MSELHKFNKLINNIRNTISTCDEYQSSGHKLVVKLCQFLREDVLIAAESKKD